MSKDDTQTGSQTSTQTGSDMSNPREVQGTVALVTVGGFMAVTGAAVIADVVRAVDPTPVLNIVAPLAMAVVAFYFGAKTAANAAASA